MSSTTTQQIADQITARAERATAAAGRWHYEDRFGRADALQTAAWIAQAWTAGTQADNPTSLWSHLYWKAECAQRDHDEYGIGQAHGWTEAAAIASAVIARAG